MPLLRRGILLLIIVMSGCAGLSDHRLKFQEVSLAYERALRWGEYDKAYAIHSNEKAPFSPQLRKRLSHIRVSGYNISHSAMGQDGNKVTQNVEIRYYDEDYAIEKKFDITIDWVFDKTIGFWRISSPFPDFK
jgi:hypothetical protein